MEREWRQLSEAENEPVDESPMMKKTATLCWAGLIVLFPGFLSGVRCAAIGTGAEPTDEAARRTKQRIWAGAMMTSRGVVQGLRVSERDRRDRLERLRAELETDFPIQCDWVLQDGGMDFIAAWLANREAPTAAEQMISRVLDELGPDGSDLRGELDLLLTSLEERTDGRWLDLYVRACERRRRMRLNPLLEQCSKVVFTKHYDLA